MKIYELNNITECDLYASGGKAKGLFKMSEAGFNVPPGFVMIDLDLGRDLDTAARRFLDSGIKHAAVRSSATAEDGADYSAAGQYATILNVSGVKEFKQAVIKCVESLYSATAESYSAYFKQAKSVKMSVVVQEMISPEFAGVCFTDEPGNDKHILIEAVRGLGEALVSGTSKSSRYSADKSDLSGAALQGIAAAEGMLSARQLHTVFSEAADMSRIFGMPLDLEWAIDREGVLYWLQARPITVSDSAEIDEFDPKYDMTGQVITKCNIGEMMPGAVTPLTISTSLEGIDYGMRKMLVTAGVYKKLSEVAPGSCALPVSNNLFINLSAIYKMEGAIVGAKMDDINLSICGKIFKEKGDTSFKKYNIFIRLNNMRRYLGFLLSRNRARKELDDMSLGLKLSGETTGSLYSDIDNKLQVLMHSVYLHYITSSHSGAMSSALFSVLNKAHKDEEKSKSIIAEFLEGIDDIESVDILRAMRSLARAFIAEYPGAGKMQAQEIAGALSVSAGETRRYYDMFMSRHGHRAVREAEMRSKGWAENPEAFAQYLATVISSGGIEPVKQPGKDLKSLIENCGVKGAAKKAVGFLAAEARNGVTNREYSKSRFIKITNIFKLAYRRLAGMLFDAGALPDADLIHFLTHQEIGRLIAEKDQRLVKRAIQRRRLLDSQARLNFNEVYVGKPAAVQNDAGPAGTGTILPGAPISRGTVTGIARVIRELKDAQQLKKGEIMVAAYTDIGWSPYYCLISGLVTEVGSALSHGAVVAREYALPLVANVNNATRLIRTGDTIRLDGTGGTVTILDGPAA